MVSLDYVPFNDLSPESFFIETKRLSLMLISEEHSEELYKLMADPQITIFLTWTPHISQDTTLDVIRSLIAVREQDKGVTWVIFYKEQICGIVSLIDIKRRHRLWFINRAELSYWLTPYFQGKGLMTEACRAILNFAFCKLRLNKIIVAHAKKNVSSEHLIKRLKFQEFGHEKCAFRKNKVWHDLIHYQMLNPQLVNGDKSNA